MRVVVLITTLVMLVGCTATTYKVDKSVVEDMRDGLLVDYGRTLGQIDARCAPSATDPACGAAREHMRKLADAYTKLKAAVKEGGTIDPELLKKIIPLISTLAPLAL
jgi:hypothetical protein